MANPVESWHSPCNVLVFVFVVRSWVIQMALGCTWKPSLLVLQYPCSNTAWVNEDWSLDIDNIKVARFFYSVAELMDVISRS